MSLPTKRTYSLTQNAIVALEDLTLNICDQTGIKISMTKVLELAIFHATRASLDDLLSVG